MPRNGFFSLSGTASQSISRRMKSVVSFALMGPPNVMAPAWPAMVSGSGSPNRGRRTSSGWPRWRKAWPRRPGVDVSWCSTIRIGWSIARSWRAWAVEISIPPRLGFSRRMAHSRHAAGAPLPLIPAQAGIQNLGPRFRGDERILHGFHATGMLAAAFLLARDQLEQQAARRKAGQRRRHAVGKARNDHAAARFQAAIAVSRYLLGGAREQPRKSVRGHARARLKLGRHRARAKHGHPHALRLELAVQRLAEREHIGLAGVIHRHAGTGHEGRDRRHVENAALAAFEAIDEGEREIGERTQVDIDHRKLLGAVERVRGSNEAEARIVDDHVRLETALLERLGDVARGIDARDVRSQNGRPARALRRNGIRQRGERLLAPRDQNEFVAVGGKLVGERGADSRRRAGDQRDRAFLLSHVGALPRRLATRWPSSIRSRDEMPRRSATRQIRLLSKSSTRPSA